jgi:hypothetical protein
MRWVLAEIIMIELHFGKCPVCFIGDMFAVVVLSSGVIRLECDSCWNQFNSPTDAQYETLEPQAREGLRPASQVEIASTGWQNAVPSYSE